MGEAVFAGLLYHFSSLKSHYPPRDMDKILFPTGELKEREFGNEAIEKEIIQISEDKKNYKIFRSLWENMALQINSLEIHDNSSWKF